MYQFSTKDFEFTLENIPPLNDNILNIYPASRIKEYMKQDLIAKRPVDNYITSEEIIELLKKYNYRCIYCHIALNFRSWT